MNRQELVPKLVGTTRSYKFDFTSDLAVGETISSQSVAAIVYSGTDASPSAIVNGSATASGSIVTQSVHAGVVGVLYELLCTITTSASQTLLKSGYLAIVPDM